MNLELCRNTRRLAAPGPRGGRSAEVLVDEAAGLTDAGVALALPRLRSVEPDPALDGDFRRAPVTGRAAIADEQLRARHRAAGVFDETCGAALAAGRPQRPLFQQAV